MTTTPGDMNTHCGHSASGSGATGRTARRQDDRLKDVDLSKLLLGLNDHSQPTMDVGYAPSILSNLTDFSLPPFSGCLSLLFGQFDFRAGGYCVFSLVFAVWEVWASLISSMPQPHWEVQSRWKNGQSRWDEQLVPGF